MIDVEGLTKVYLRSRKDGAKALDGVTFDVRDRTIFDFLGPNGAGKTTTRILATTPQVARAGPPWTTAASPGDCFHRTRRQL